MAFDRIDPIGRQRFDFLAAMISAAVLAPHSKKAPDPMDLMPRFGPAGQQRADESDEAKVARIKAFFMAFTRRAGGTIVEAPPKQ